MGRISSAALVRNNKVGVCQTWWPAPFPLPVSRENPIATINQQRPVRDRRDGQMGPIGEFPGKSGVNDLAAPYRSLTHRSRRNPCGDTPSVFLNAREKWNASAKPS